MKSRYQKGSVTVEAVLVFPIIFLGIIAIMYISIINFQNISTSTTAMQSSNRIAIAWQHIGGSSPSMLKEVDEAKDMLRSETFKNHDPYRFIIDGKKIQREKNGTEYALKLARKVPEIHTSDTDNKDMIVKKTDAFLMQYIEVTTNKSYINPLGKTFEKLGIQDKNKNIITARVVLTSPTELIRNIDFINEILQRNKEQ